MGIFKKRTVTKGLACPTCGGNDLGVGYIDRVKCTVLHTCDSCGERWRDHLIDLAPQQVYG